MQQNKYDDPDFFKHYSQMPRSVEGLASAGEWPVFRSLLPDMRGKPVLDLGCGFGWHCRYAREQGAASVLGVDISQNMLSRASEVTYDSGITYTCAAIEDVEIAPSAFDVVISSLSLHYVGPLDSTCDKIHRGLTQGGAFVFSVEHPIFTARAEQDWILGENGERLHWPLDNYQLEGPRHTNWLAADVIKYHRTMASYINALLGAGLSIKKVEEPGPSLEMMHDRPDLKDESRRPMFLLISAEK